MKIENIKSERSEKSVRNQFIIHDNGKTYFQSYNSLVAVWNGDKLTLGVDWDYSKTTSKYLNQFLREYCYKIVRQFDKRTNAESIRALIKAGVIKYDPKMV